MRVDGAQDKDATPRLEMANDRKSGLHMAIVCRMLDREPSFFSKADSQVHSEFQVATRLDLIMHVPLSTRTARGKVLVQTGCM